eukprot:702763-Pyramimonas_sp.AAC.1
MFCASAVDVAACRRNIGVSFAQGARAGERAGRASHVGRLSFRRVALHFGRGRPPLSIREQGVASSYGNVHPGPSIIPGRYCEVRIGSLGCALVLITAHPPPLRESG